MDDKIKVYVLASSLFILLMLVGLVVFNNTSELSTEDKIKIEQEKYSLECNKAMTKTEYDACIKLDYAINYGCD